MSAKQVWEQLQAERVDDIRTFVEITNRELKVSASPVPSTLV